jgi:hypothetical protein
MVSKLICPSCSLPGDATGNGKFGRERDGERISGSMKWECNDVIRSVREEETGARVSRFWAGLDKTGNGE